MLEFAHALTGGIIAYKISSPAVSLPLAFFSHFLLDLLPHWNPSLTKEKQKFHQIRPKIFFFVLADCLFGLFLGLFLAFKSLPSTTKALTVIFGCFFGILPDLVESPYYFLNLNHPLFQKIINFQSKRQFNTTPFWGILFQVLYLIFLLSII